MSLSRKLYQFILALAFIFGAFPMHIAMAKGLDSSQAAIQVAFKGIVLSQFSQSPLSDIAVEIKADSGEKTETDLTNAAGEFTAQLDPQKEYTINFFKELSVGKALVSSKKLTFTAEKPTHTFRIPVSGKKSTKKAIDFQGDILVDGKPLNGLMTITQESTNRVKDQVKIIDGHFMVSLSMTANSSLAINLSNGSQEYPKAYTLNASNWDLESHTIQLHTTPPSEIAAAPNTMASPMPAEASTASQKHYRVAFQGSSDQIANPSQQTLDQLVAQWKSSNAPISVRGFAPSYNIPLYDLVQRRVLSVVEYLQSKGLEKEAIHYSYAFPKEEDTAYEGYLIRIR